MQEFSPKTRLLAPTLNPCGCPSCRARQPGRRDAHLLGAAERSPPVHVILRVHDEHHLVGVELEPTVHVAGAFHPDQPLPGALHFAAQSSHLLALPLAELFEVSRRKGGLGSAYHAWLSASSASRAGSTTMKSVFPHLVFRLSPGSSSMHF